MAREAAGNLLPPSNVEPNAEGEDLAVPLPREWDLEALREMQVTLYSGKISPPCCKIRFLLEFYQVPHTLVDGKKPGSTYQKIPVLDIGDRQINDSFIIVKSLAPILQGRPLTLDELEIERQVTFGLMVAAEKQTASSIQELCSCGALLGGCMGCLLRSSSCALSCVAPRKIGAGKDLRSMQEYGDMLREHIGAGSFMGGGDKPSVLDVSVFGVLEPFNRAGCSCIDDLLGDSGNALRSWHNRMRAATAEVNIFGS
eukprot:CAMPEP_0115187690 /NCGR_PEP_ID=MMETSP0270-20121206/10623_1 /TAXON_ID=71861 /ORGANISM="Scrippsiella trochoidea, Strain CCMP3099" /LENGTH=255 /DNA_ID=CAMNT_0002600845 /DNA_START=62 /DNA_END=829 /DNA_ORIENTATION=+